VKNITREKKLPKKHAVYVSIPFFVTLDYRTLFLYTTIMFKRAMLTVIIFILPLALISQNRAFAAEETTLNPTDDVSMTNRFPNQTSSANVILNISYTPGNEGQYISFFNFDLADIPGTAKIESADLVLAQKPDSDDTDVPFTAMLITEDWAQQSITWLTRPDTTGSKLPIASEDFALGGRGYTRFDLTKLLQEWVSNEDTIYGLQIEGPKNIQYNKIFHSTRGGVAPRLVVGYSVPAGVIGEHGMIQKEAYLPQDETGGSMREEIGDMMEETAAEDGADATETTPEEIADVSALENNLAQVLTPTTIKIAAGAIFLLILVKLLLPKRS